MKITALCCYRNAATYLGEFIDHLEPYVDKFLFLDDRSDPVNRERAINIVYRTNKCDEVIMRASRYGDPFSRESRNRRILLNEALYEGVDWALCLDADERLELNFLKDLRGICEGATVPAYSLNVRDLWNTPMQYRVDPPWNAKAKLVLFHLPTLGASVPDGLHQPWLKPDVAGSLGYNLYHYGSLTPELRAERVARHEAADPGHKWQAGYKYLAEEGPGLKLERIEPGRNWY